MSRFQVVCHNWGERVKLATIYRGEILSRDKAGARKISDGVVVCVNCGCGEKMMLVDRAVNIESQEGIQMVHSVEHDHLRSNPNFKDGDSLSVLLEVL